MLHAGGQVRSISVQATLNVRCGLPGWLVVVAEGAEQELLDGVEAAGDASGNTGLRDVGALLRRRFAEHFADTGIEASIRFIDPSYAIRSVRNSEHLGGGRAARQPCWQAASVAHNDAVGT